MCKNIFYNIDILKYLISSPRKKQQLLKGNPETFQNWALKVLLDWMEDERV